MRTPGHAVINLCLLGGLVLPGAAGAIVAGAVLPDLPIMALYALERLRGRPEEEIWRLEYQQRPWIDLIHGAHSIPLAGLGLLAAVALASPGGIGFFASLLLHSTLDLPLHVHDAHRHFLPFSSWRFVSPLSYWDERYHGRAVTTVEAAIVAGAGAVLWPPSSTLGRILLLLVTAWYGWSCWQMRPQAARAVS